MSINYQQTDRIVLLLSIFNILVNRHGQNSGHFSNLECNCFHAQFKTNLLSYPSFYHKSEFKNTKQILSINP